MGIKSLVVAPGAITWQIPALGCLLLPPEPAPSLLGAPRVLGAPYLGDRTGCLHLHVLLRVPGGDRLCGAGPGAGARWISSCRRLEGCPEALNKEHQPRAGVPRAGSAMQAAWGTPSSPPLRAGGSSHLFPPIALALSPCLCFLWHLSPPSSHEAPT